MNIKNIPRGIPSTKNIAQPIELGSGMQDRRVNHISNEDIITNTHFDPKDQSRSDYHGLTNKQFLTPIESRDIKKEVLFHGEIKDALMFPQGAHLKVIGDDENEYFIFADGIDIVSSGTRVTVYDVMVTNTYENMSGRDYQEQERKIRIEEES